MLCLTRYVSTGASSRVRVLQYLPYLENSGIQFELSPLFDEQYISDLYARRERAYLSVLRAYWRRLAVLLRRSSYDLIWLEKELFPWFPFFFDNLFLRAGKPYVLDYDDAIFHRYDLHHYSLVRNLLGAKIARLIRKSTSVIAGSHYISAYAQKAGAARVAFLPSVIDIADYPVRAVKTGERFTIGWIGTPITAKAYLPSVLPVLQKLATRLDFRLVLIGAGDVHAEGIEIESREWALNKEAELLADVDVGIMPLTDGPWERGKCGYKLIQYMACGIPVVASAVGENNYIVREGENGFLARSEEEWLRAFTCLAEEPERARAMGLAGRRLVEQEYSLQVTAPRLLSILREAASRTGEP